MKNITIFDDTNMMLLERGLSIYEVDGTKLFNLYGDIVNSQDSTKQQTGYVLYLIPRSSRTKEMIYNFYHAIIFQNSEIQDLIQDTVTFPFYLNNKIKEHIPIFIKEMQEHFNKTFGIK